MRKQSVLAASSLTIAAIACTAVLSEALAQDVRFGTDPGAAHPRYAEQAGYAEAAPNELRYATATPYAADPIHRVASERTIVVAPGDTVYGIARANGVKPTALIEANGLQAPYTLALGQTLILPDAGKGTAAVQSAPVEPKAVKVNAEPVPAPIEAQDLLTGRIEPIEERARLDALYGVRPGDTLFGVSRKFGVPVEELARTNGLEAPYTLSLGQRLVIPSAVPATPLAERPAAPSPEATPETLPADQAVLVSRAPRSRFAWPLQGAVVMSYGVTQDGVRNDGINIAAPVGAPIRAAADGEVVYRGDELEGYGNLLLVRHEDGWVSAYAHADTILVRKGDLVRQGQVVAKVGKSGSVDAPQLHFELRHDLKPQDPIQALNGSLQTAAAKVRYQ